MKMVKTPNYKKIKQDINKKVYKALETSGTSTILALKKRIKRGADADGVAFKSLSKSTLADKAKRGKRFMFEDSGDMLRSIKHKTKSGKEPKILFHFDDADENKKAYDNINIHKRDFFNLSDKEVDRVVKKISDSLINL